MSAILEKKIRDNVGDFAISIVHVLSKTNRQDDRIHLFTNPLIQLLWKKTFT